MRLSRTTLLLSGLLAGCSPAIVDLSHGSGEESPGLTTHFEILPADAYTPGMVQEAVAAYSAQEPQLLYLNFEGGQLVGCANHCSDARTNRSWMLGGTKKVPAFDHKSYGADRAQVIAQVVRRVSALYSRFNVQVVTERPATANYSMILIGGGPDLALQKQDVVSTSPVDCGNRNRGDIGFVFTDAYVLGVDLLAVAIAHEAGHTFGLAHVKSDGDIMNRYLSSTATFTDTVQPVVDENCAGITTQSAAQLLRENLGVSLAAPPSNTTTPAAPVTDTNPPLVTVISPGPDSYFPPYTQITIDITASDPSGLATVELVWYWNGAVKVPTAVSDNHYYFDLVVGEGQRDFAVHVSDLLGNDTTTQSTRLFFQ